MKKFAYLAVLAAAAVAFAAPVQAAWPEKPIRIIVPWGAGGSTDQAIRAIAGDIEDGLGQKVVVVNQPGGGGAIGTQSVLDAPHDGYTWAAGAVKDMGTYIVRGSLNTKVQDWHLFFNSANATLVSVNPDAPVKDFGEFLAMMKSDPQKVTVAIAGIPSSGHDAIVSIKRAAGGDYKSVSYDGGNPAVIATVAGECMATPQLLNEQIEMIRAKKLRPLAALTPEDLDIDGYGMVPTIKKWLPGFSAAPIYFGIWAPKDIPAEAVKAMEKVWVEKVAKSKALKEFAFNKSQVVAPYFGEEAQKKGWPSIQAAAWALFDAGQAKVSPDTVGIPRP